jgi:hypothetical protein
MGRIERTTLIEKIEHQQNSRLICYCCADRPPMPGQIGEDSVRPFYDVVREIGKVPRIDLFLYSHGGASEVPWRLVSMLREHCDHLTALIPYHAHSAATLIALGCDEIFLGKKAELGAIDPAMKYPIRDGQYLAQEDIRVEDVMAFIDFLRDKVKITDDNTLAKFITSLTDRLRPWNVGQIYRIHTHIRTVAEQMLRCHSSPKNDEIIHRIIQTLAEETRSHGHGISRREAKQLGLNVTIPDDILEENMWLLLEEFEYLCKIRDPIDPETALGQQDAIDIREILALIESSTMTWAFRGDLKLMRTRQAIPNYEIKAKIDFNLNLVPPPGMDLQNISPQLIEAVCNIVKVQIQPQLQQQIPLIYQQVHQQVQMQSPPGQMQARFVGKWMNVTSEGI